MNGFRFSGARLAQKLSRLACVLMLSSLWIGEVARVEAVTYTAAATGNWDNPATWGAGSFPGAGDNVLIGTLPTTVGNFNITVPLSNQFGDPLNNSEWVESGGNSIILSAGATLTHNAGSTFITAPFNNIWRINGGAGSTFVNDGTMIMLPRPNSWDTGRLNGNVTFQNNGVLEYQDVAGNGSSRSNSLLVEGNSMNVSVNSVGANPGVIRVNMANPNFVATLGFRQSETSNRFTYTGDVGETPFQIVSGNLIFGLPGQGTLPSGLDANFKYNGLDFNGNSATLSGGAPMHSTFDRTVFDDLFGSASGAIPAGSRVGVSGAFDTIDLISANSGTTANPWQHNFDGRIGIASSGWQTPGNMMPTSNGGTMNITAQTDADWYNGGFNTRGGTINNFGKLTAPLGLTMNSDENSTGTATGDMYIGNSTGTGNFNNNVGGTVRIEEGRLQVRDANNTFHNYGTFELAGNGANLYVGASGTFTQEAGGTINFDPGVGNTAYVTGDTSLGRFNNNSGVPMTVTSGTLRFGPGVYQVNGVTQSTITAATINGAFSPGAGNLEFMPAAADVIDVDPSLLPAGIKASMTSGMAGLTPTSTVTFTAQNVVDWHTGHLSLQNGGMVNNGVINKIAGSSGYQLNSSNLQNNTFTNNGQFNLQAGSGEFYIYQSTTFDNYGALNLLGTGNSNIRPVNGGIGTNGQVIYNELGGVIKSETQLDTQQNNIYILNGPTPATAVPQIRNEGTIEVTRGIFRIWESNPTYSDFVSATATELTEGTYSVLASTNIANQDMARLDLSIIDGSTAGSADSYTGSITSIGAAAKVVLSSDAPLTTTSGAQFLQLGEINNLEGGLYVHNAVILPVSSALHVQSGAFLGGNGTFDMQGGSLTVDNGGTLDPTALGGGVGTLTVDGNLLLNPNSVLDFQATAPGVNDEVVVTGDLTLDGMINLDNFGIGSYTLFEYDPNGVFTFNGLDGLYPLTQKLDFSTPGFVFLNVIAVPEPSSLMLLGLGTLLMTQTRRRRRNARQS